jgi:16S rRNA (guanine966-N2)-methyltransferase
VEKDKAAADVIKANISAIKKPLEATQIISLHQQDSRSFLRQGNLIFDLVFIDPPYEMDSSQVLVDLELVVRLLTKDSLVVLERATKNLYVLLPEGLVELETKKYGDTSLIFIGKN